MPTVVCCQWQQFAAHQYQEPGVLNPSSTRQGSRLQQPQVILNCQRMHQIDAFSNTYDSENVHVY